MDFKCMLLQFTLIKTMIKWKEHEHELDDIVALKTPRQGPL
jgi:hypothetical protein